MKKFKVLSFSLLALFAIALVSFSLRSTNEVKPVPVVKAPVVLPDPFKFNGDPEDADAIKNLANWSTNSQSTVNLTVCPGVTYLCGIRIHQSAGIGTNNKPVQAILDAVAAVAVPISTHSNPPTRIVVNVNGTDVDVDIYWFD